MSGERRSSVPAAKKSRDKSRRGWDVTLALGDEVLDLDAWARQYVAALLTLEGVRPDSDHHTPREAA